VRASVGGASREAFAPAKVNLTLRVLGRRPDGYHLIESLVAFARIGDRLQLQAGKPLGLTVHGATRSEAGPLAENLVLKAAHALIAEIPALKTGHFTLDKQLPVAAGIGGGSADAGAALRLLAELNGVAPDDARLKRAAARTGADVPVCLDPRARIMRGIGEVLSPPVALPALPALLVNPRIAVPTRDVFAALDLAAGGRNDGGDDLRDDAAYAFSSMAEVMRALAASANDLEAPAIRLHPRIGAALDELRAVQGCRLARMSGSGATCFALFDTQDEASAAAQQVSASHPDWWVAAIVLS
jgi:4-diphosphocytidyl-2-C-methyl-D-erythritol kinase